MKSDKIDWKKVSKSNGYISLKSAYIKDVNEGQHSYRRSGYHFRSKKEFYFHFKKAIGLAVRYSVKWDIDIIDVLNYWESKRDYWWLSFYQDSCVRRHKPSL